MLADNKSKRLRMLVRNDMLSEKLKIVIVVVDMCRRRSRPFSGTWATG